MVEDDFSKSYQDYDDKHVDELLAAFCREERDLREVIEYLIAHREMIRNGELEKLEREARQLTKTLQNTHARKMLEEIRCFKDVLALQKRLVKQNDARR